MNLTASSLNDLQDVLDELLSPRSSDRRIYAAIASLERQVAAVCLSGDENHDFWALQYTFECNVPSRLLHWIAVSTPRLDASCTVVDKEINALSYHVSLALSVLQGVALNHPASKSYLGRKYSLEILLDLLLASRHIPSITPPTSASTLPAPAPLSSTVIDTLLCIMVDSTAALRAFEEAGGLQVIVKILKRAGTPREVRMKCLEFLYFYLLDETLSASSVGDQLSADALSVDNALPPTAPVTPTRQEKPFVFPTPSNPISNYGSSTYVFSTTTSAGSARSVSSSSTSSFSSTSSVATSSTAASSAAPSRSASPDKSSACKAPIDSTPSGIKAAKARPLMMLRKDVDYVPMSPKKAQVSNLGVRPPSGSATRSRYFHSNNTPRPPSRLGSAASITEPESKTSPTKTAEPVQAKQADVRTKTTKEKKELLGTMLGNVDALVEGVRKAGVWGLI
ncbi:hypothetical protein PC9H_004702 [Pleurotus ostreatus]|uniref:Uncharacterized protein n=1 Tax=Pleurotus ostreatus TaxID=5322 RepID=A0A8H7DTQ8_PLEOS|nr:uncharacterized protein PC9H_004702 [Pleurotus ostreatus]KAF7432759.1 hypothetical protein PC9H_004702 [Pleurotus ostreatus]